MTTYSSKKKYIYGYRKRQSFLGYVEKMKKIVETASTRDLNKFRDLTNDVYFLITGKLGYWDIHDSLRESAMDKKLKSGESKYTDAVAYYICPVCKKKGYLFSPNIDGRTLDLYMVHLFWPEEEVKFCHLGKTKTYPIMIVAEAREGILMNTKYPIIELN